MKKIRRNISFKLVSFFVSFVFILTSFLPLSQAQSVLNLPAPGTRINLTQATVPILIKGITLHPENPLRFDFIINSGTSSTDTNLMKKEGYKQVKYFMAALTVPEKEMWVNLSPYERNRVISDSLGHTEMGRDLLAQDYMLKQLSSSLIYPESQIGKSFWDRIYDRAKKEYGVTNIPVDIFHKIWIIPEKAVVYEKGNSAFVVDAHLKVMLEEDYQALAQSQVAGKTRSNKLSSEEQKLVTSVIKDIVLPEVEKEINQGESFANLRQIYHAMILATWFKKNLKESILGKVYVDQAKTTGIHLDDETINKKVYQQYLEAFKKGVYNYIKEDYDPQSQQIIPKKYFSGGFVGEVSKAYRSYKEGTLPSSIRNQVTSSVSLDSKDLAMTVDLVEAGPEANKNEVDKISQQIEEQEPEPFSSSDLLGLEKQKRWKDLDRPSQDFWVTLRKIYDDFLKHKKEGKVSEALRIRENFFPSAILTAEERTKLLGAIDYRQLVSEVSDSSEGEILFKMVMTALDAGLGTSVRRSAYVKQHIFPVTGRDVLGAKGTDLGFNVHGRFVSVAEIKLLRLIKEVEEKKYPGEVVFQPIVSEIDEKGTTTYDEILDYPFFGQNDKTYTYAKKLKELNIVMVPRVVKDYPSLDVIDLKPTFERGASGSHGEWGFKFLREALDYKAEGSQVIGFYNGDGTNNAPDPYIAMWMLKNNIPIVMISTTKTGIDKKGGQIGIEYLDDAKTMVRVRMLEQASAKANGQLEDFNDMGLKDGDGPQYFNTNISLINYGLIAKILQTLREIAFENNESELLKLLVPDLISGVKKKKGKGYIQLEGPIGTVFLNIHNYFETHPEIKNQVNDKLKEQGIEGFERILKIVNISAEDREKFFTPIKEASDFWFQAHTNFYKLNTETWMLENTFKGKVPPEFDLKYQVVETDDEGVPILVINDETGARETSMVNYYSDVTNLIDAFGESADVVDAKESLESLSVKGLVKIPNFKLRGRISINNKSGLPLVTADFSGNKNIKIEDGKLTLRNINIQKTEQGIVSVEPIIQEDNALVSEGVDIENINNNQATYGGIDLNPELLDLQIKRDGNGVALPLIQQPIKDMNIKGFLPVIINIQVAPSLSVLLGFNDSLPKGVDNYTAWQIRQWQPVDKVTFFYAEMNC